MGYAEEEMVILEWDGLRNPPYEAGILANTWKKMWVIEISRRAFFGRGKAGVKA